MTKMNPTVIKLSTDIRFWIVLFFLVRLYGITFPPLELSHTWRQTDGTTIARNFYERDNNIFFPRIDMTGEKDGVVGSEFPLLNYLIYLTSVIFGYSHWYGRLIVLLFSSFGVFYFHRIISRYFNAKIALHASLLLMASFWFSYSRKIIPDVFAVSLSIISLHYALSYLRQGKLHHLILFLCLGSLACLSKILAATILTVLILPVFNSQIPTKRKVILSITATLILAAVVAWYFAWVPYLNSTYGNGEFFFMGMSYDEAFGYILRDLKLVLKRLFISPFKYVGAVAMIASLAVLIKNRNWISIFVLALPFVSYLVIIAKTGSYMVGDHYYILTVIPCFAFLIATGLNHLKNSSVAAFIVLIICLESVGDQVYDFNLRKPFASFQNLEAVMDKVTDPSDLIAVSGEANNPTFLYFSHRRGWASSGALLQQESYLADKVDRGCKFVVVAKEIYGDINLDYPIVYDTSDFKIYKVSGR